MKAIQFILLVLNTILLIILDLVLWNTSWMFGLGGVIGIVGFFIGYAISVDMSIAPRDFWRFPKYEIFKMKIVYGNSIAVTTCFISTAIIYAIWSVLTGNL